MKIEIELLELKKLLTEQKRITANKLLDGTHTYNPKSTEGHLYSMDIDKDKFITKAMCAPFPEDVAVLEKYLSNK